MKIIVGDHVFTREQLVALPVGATLRDDEDDDWVKAEDGALYLVGGNYGVGPDNPHLLNFLACGLHVTALP